MHNIDLLSSRVLIIDDNKDNTDLLGEMLKEYGFYNVLGINDSRTAFNIYNAYRPDVVLLDLNMPHVSGFDLLKLFMDHDEDEYVPVLVLTALTDIESRDRALELGALDFLTKPFDTHEVLQRLKNLLTVRHMNLQLREKNELLSEKVKAKTQELQQARIDIIHILGQAVEFRDVETGFHIERISKMSRLLAECADMSPHEADVIENASPMHDVGKIGIPDSILLKPAALTPKEFDTMKQHTVIGYKLLHKDEMNSSEIIQASAEIAISHHERWDGGGYPYGLAGEDIPIRGRIVGLVDVFDALTSKRVYKPAFKVEESIDIINLERGKHFDPELVDVFLKNVQGFIKIVEGYEARGEA